MRNAPMMITAILGCGVVVLLSCSQVNAADFQYGKEESSTALNNRSKSIKYRVIHSAQQRLHKIIVAPKIHIPSMEVTNVIVEGPLLEGYRSKPIVRRILVGIRH